MMRSLSRLRRAAREERGSSLIEIAISVVVLVTLFMGLMDFSRAVYSWAFVSWAAQSGTRYAIVRGSRWAGTACSSTATTDCEATSANVQAYVQALAPPGVTGTKVSATTQWPGASPDSTTDGGTDCTKVANSRGCFVEVKVGYTFHFITPFLPSTGINFTGTSEQVIQD